MTVGKFLTTLLTTQSVHLPAVHGFPARLEKNNTIGPKAEWWSLHGGCGIERYLARCEASIKHANIRRSHTAMAGIYLTKLVAKQTLSA